VAVAAPGWQETLARYGVGIVLIEPQTGLAYALRETPGWRVAHEDELAVLFVTDTGV
jgi:hypothetical protein